MKICEDDNYLDGIVYQEDDLEMEIEAHINYDNLQIEMGPWGDTVISEYLGDGLAYEENDYGDKFWYLTTCKSENTFGAIPSYSIVNPLHRIDGPAIEYADGDKCWYLNGVEYSEEDFEMAKEFLWAV
jgi:hypothetical protein